MFGQRTQSSAHPISTTLKNDENYNKFLAFKKENDELLAKSAEEIEIDCYEQKIAELKEKLNQYGK